jgi:hypothetical protein
VISSKKGKTHKKMKQTKYTKRFSTDLKFLQFVPDCDKTKMELASKMIS